ncbi:MAG: SPOR domain-containing protein [Bernardetiaceae bacterium]
MRSVFFVLVFCSLSFLSESQVLDSAIFYTGTYEQMRQEAKQSNKHYMLYFYIRGSNADQQARLLTFTPELIKATQNDYMRPLSVRAFSIFGDYLVKKYKIKDYPQILVFTSGDRLLERIETFVPAGDLVKKLKTLRQSTGTADTIDVFKENRDPNLVNVLQNEAQLLGMYKVRVDDSQTKDMPNPVGIQLGVFKDYNHTMRAIFELGLEANDNVLVSMHRQEDRTFLRLVLGPFATIAEAEVYQSELRNTKGLYGYLVDLNDFRPLEAIDEEPEDSPFIPLEESLGGGK